MNRVTLFASPTIFTSRVTELGQDIGEAQAELLLQVELGFALLERLRLDDEPVTAVWALLSGTPLRHPRLQALDADERRAVANARQIIPYSSRFAWMAALRTYFNLPLNSRQYQIGKDFPTLDLNKIILNGIKNDASGQKVNQHIYNHCLSAPLKFRQRAAPLPVQADIRYEFTAKLAENPKELGVTVEFEQKHLDSRIPLPVWPNQPRSREPFLVELSKLQTIAEALDDREHLLGWDASRLGHWVKRFKQITLHPVEGNGALGAANPDFLDINGFYHLAGMVASGKSTLSLLLAAHVVRDRPDDRLTLVVSDVQAAIRLANLINWWFNEAPENDDPVAVPLLGRFSRDKHLRDFYASQDYLDYQRREKPHWGERWLGTACALQSLIHSRDLTEMNGQAIIPGNEPCQSLKKFVPGSRTKPSKSSLCPFFASCPSHQLSRDMPHARVWITTSGGMALGSLPRHTENRPIHFGELVYEHSSLVIFDEADTVLNWFDDVYAEEINLTGNEKGVFDSLGVQTEAFSRRERVPFAGTQRWVGAERGSQTAISALLALLDRQEGQKFLQDWVAHSSFTPNMLFYRLARRIAGLEEFDAADMSEEQSGANEAQTQGILKHFDALFEDADPLRLEAPEETSPEQELSLLLGQINAVGNSASDDRIHTKCQEWIMKHFPEAENWQQKKRAARERTGRKESNSKKNNSKQIDFVDTPETLAYRLQFALTAALLDRHTRIVFYEWHNRPSSPEDDQPPHRRMPAALLDILPLPPTGRQFGTYYSRGAGNDRDLEERNSKEGNGKALSLFAYTNIGRCYILNFHRLLTDYDGRPGPAVLALSGTSYLPASTRFHVSKPQGILMPEANASRAIQTSAFEFLPQYDRNGKAIKISGVREDQKFGMFNEMAEALVGRNGSGILGRKMKELQTLGIREPALWHDRERLLLLVNSYDQAAWVAKAIRDCWPGLHEKFSHLDRIKKNGRLEDFVADAGLHRTDIEAFVSTGSKILVAPMNAIGRGHNILNENGKAAFGAVYFLTRPYPHPHDTQAIAQEINRRTLDWAEDPDFIAWKEGDGVLGRAESVRRLATRYWRSAEQRTYYKTLRDDEELREYPREDLAATTAGLIIQAVGRLVRGGVPFHAAFVDAAWGPNNAEGKPEEETPKSSLLAALIQLLCEDYVDKERDPIGHALYGPLADALAGIENFVWHPVEKNISRKEDKYL